MIVPGECLIWEGNNVSFVMLGRLLISKLDNARIVRGSLPMLIHLRSVKFANSKIIPTLIRHLASVSLANHIKLSMMIILAAKLLLAQLINQKLDLIELARFVLKGNPLAHQTLQSVSQQITPDSVQLKLLITIFRLIFAQCVLMEQNMIQTHINAWIRTQYYQTSAL